MKNSANDGAASGRGRNRPKKGGQEPDRAQNPGLFKVELIPIQQLRPNPTNPRHNDHAVDAVARSIQAFGWNCPIITDADLNIAAGHTRLKAAKKLGFTKVPVIRVPGLVGAKLIGYGIAENKVAEIADWDEESLQQLIAELNEDVDFDLNALGYDDNELTRLLDQGFPGSLEKEDEAPPLPEQPITKTGDLWLLGQHRLLCRDATKIEDVRQLTDGQRVDCLLTDPPYGVNYSSRGRKKQAWGGIQNDNLDPDHLEKFLVTAFKNAAAVSRPGATGYVFHGISKAGIRIAFERAFLGAGFQLGSTIIWVKPSASMGWGDYREQHEPILYGWLGKDHRRIKDRTQTTVWQIGRDGDYRHPTQKPVALISRALRNSTIRGEVVLDPFVGSGTTIIACEQLGRRCFAMEVDPRYCDVAVQRWECCMGRKANMISPSTKSDTENGNHE
ncbi:MAG: DNA modification methylase [bacterium]